MVIDLTSLVIGNTLEVSINDNVDCSLFSLENTSIRKLYDVIFQGSVVRLSDSDYQISGKIKGVMVLPDDITLEDVIYPFEIEVEDNFSDFESDSILKIIQNKLDITEYLWQNILVEVPLKVKNDKNESLTLEGDGWRLITEEDLKKEKDNESPFSELSKIFDSGKE